MVTPLQRQNKETHRPQRAVRRTRQRRRMVPSINKRVHKQNNVPNRVKCKRLVHVTRVRQKVRPGRIPHRREHRSRGNKSSCHRQHTRHLRQLSATYTRANTRHTGLQPRRKRHGRYNRNRHQSTSRVHHGTRNTRNRS